MHRLVVAGRHVFARDVKTSGRSVVEASGHGFAVRPRAEPPSSRYDHPHYWSAPLHGRGSYTRAAGATARPCPSATALARRFRIAIAPIPMTSSFTHCKEIYTYTSIEWLYEQNYKSYSLLLSEITSSLTNSSLDENIEQSWMFVSTQ